MSEKRQRLQSLRNLVDADSLPLVEPLLEDIVTLEEQLETLRGLPQIVVHPVNKELQKRTVASKMYKEYLQQYINAIKAVEYIVYKDKRLEGEEVEDSPLRKWFKMHE